MLNLLLGLLISAIALPPKPAHYVTDNAAVLPADRVQALDQKLQSFERETSNQVIVFVDRKVPDGTTLEEMGAQAIREWGVGQKEKNNGVILFLFTDDRKMRIEVGYGLEGRLTDARSKLITSSIMKPRLRDGDYSGAIEHGVEAILNTVRGEGFQGSGRTVAEANVGGAGSNMLPWLVPGVIALVGGILLLVVILFLRTLLRNPRAAFATTRPDGSSFFTTGSSSDSSWSSENSSSSSSSSDSGSDFSGGGGDGGGGGASDSW